MARGLPYNSRKELGSDDRATLLLSFFGYYVKRILRWVVKTRPETTMSFTQSEAVFSSSVQTRLFRRSSSALSLISACPQRIVPPCLFPRARCVVVSRTRCPCGLPPRQACRSLTQSIMKNVLLSLGLRNSHLKGRS